MRILTIVYDSLLLGRTNSVLARQGHFVEGADTLGQALELSAILEWDLVMIENSVPGQDAAFLEKLIRFRSNTPVALITDPAKPLEGVKTFPSPAFAGERAEAA